MFVQLFPHKTKVALNLAANTTRRIGSCETEDHLGAGSGLAGKKYELDGDPSERCCPRLLRLYVLGQQTTFVIRSTRKIGN